MVFKEENGSFLTPIDPTKTKKAIEGYLLSSKVVESTKFENGRAVIHELMTEDGELIAVWGKGQLTHRLNTILEKSPGAMTRITYLNKTTITKGKKTLPMHNFKVEFDAENVRSL